MTSFCVNQWIKAMALALALGSVSCLTSNNDIVVSVSDQKMALMKQGEIVKTYPVSTSKFGLGSQRNSSRTPLGKMKIAKKIGHKAPKGAVFKSRKRTGEILKPNAPGRDPIVTRILWLSGLERKNRNTFSRFIYIHGTPEERKIGKPVSYGCIRMTSNDVIDLFNRVGVGSRVKIVKKSLFHYKESDQFKQAKAAAKQKAKLAKLARKAKQKQLKEARNKKAQQARNKKLKKNQS